MATSPTQLSLKKMRGDEFRTAIVEHWNAFAHKRYDLYGYADLLGVGDGRTIAVQTTTSGHVAERVRKILDDRTDAAKDCLHSGWEIEVHGWKQKKKGAPWKVRIVDITLDEFDNLVATERK